MLDRLREPVDIKVQLAKVVNSIEATETHDITSFTVDMINQTCIFQSENMLEWMSGESSCSSCTQKETVISGDDFGNIFNEVADGTMSRYDDIVQALQKFLDTSIVQPEPVVLEPPIKLGKETV
jgi:hypothetical protein